MTDTQATMDDTTTDASRPRVYLAGPDAPHEDGWADWRASVADADEANDIEFVARGDDGSQRVLSPRHVVDGNYASLTRADCVLFRFVGGLQHMAFFELGIAKSHGIPIVVWNDTPDPAGQFIEGVAEYVADEAKPALKAVGIAVGEVDE